MIGTLLMGGASLYNMHQGNKKMSNIAANQPSAEDIRGESYGRSQGLIDRMTNFGQYSGQAMDLASQQGNQGVEDAMMMGMGGSQANAIRNRMKRSSMTGVYDKFNQGLGQAAGLQQGIDSGIAGQMQGQRQYANNVRMTQANNQMGMGMGLLGEGGLGPEGLLGQLMGGIGIKK
jgi:hypothetical protein|tara:strand:+ start:73 stop:597 length:525 start_codon:yes stop_codon:yes gene_type:complete